MGSWYFGIGTTCYRSLYQDQPNRPMIFVNYLLLLENRFQSLIVPVRAVTGDDEYYKREAVRIGQTYRDIKLFEDTQLNHITTFCITQQTGKLPTTQLIWKATYLLYSRLLFSWSIYADW